MRTIQIRTGAIALAAACTALMASLGAQQAGGGAGAGAAQQPRPYTPVAASTLTSQPDNFIGVNISMTAAVDQILSKTAFTIEPNTSKNGEREVLVLTPVLSGPVDLHAYVTVLGEVVRFDPAEVAKKSKDIKVDLPPDVVEKYRGKPAVLATGVINNKFVDLAKKLPPPMTAEETAFSKVMKKVGPTFAALRTAVDGNNGTTAAETAVILKQAFTETEAFWKTRAKTDAIGWAQDALKQAESIEKDAAGGNWDAATKSTATLGQACQSCHGTYRERFDDGSYRIKMSAQQ